MRAAFGRTLGIAWLCVACAPALTRDGQVVFTPESQRGGSILTAHGIEFVDRSYLPKPVVRKSAFEPWSAPAGFLLPADGVWTRVSEPLSLDLPALELVLRTSDAFVPSWGGELLVRIDARARPRAQAAKRAPMLLVLVLADRRGRGVDLARTALHALESGDLVAIVDADGSQVVLPPVPCTHRTLATAALRRRTAGHDPSMRRDLAWALEQSQSLLGRSKNGKGAAGMPRRVLVVLDVNQRDVAAAERVRALERAGASVLAVAADSRVSPSGGGPFAMRLVTGNRPDRLAAVEASMARSGRPLIGDLSVSFSSLPAPTRIIEASDGLIESDLDADSLRWSGMSAGEARTEVVRLSLPVWTPGESLELNLAARYLDLETGSVRESTGRFVMRFSDDVYWLGKTRHGDVIAYASALAMVHRLGRAFLGSRADSVDGFRQLVEWQARSMFSLSRRFRDPAMQRQGEMLEALLRALDG